MTTLHAFTQYLQTVSSLHFVLPDGQAIPSHFHITEIALVDKTYIDCGGTKRHEQIVTMQLWVAGDTDHRLTPKKLLSIIDGSRSMVADDNLPLIFESQGATIQSRSWTQPGSHIQLTPLFTNCLAMDKCGIVPEQTSCCAGGTCC